MLTPIAQYQARIAIEDMYGSGSRRSDYSVLPTAIFTDPELAGVGLSEAEAVAAGHDVEVVRHPLSAVTRALRRVDAGEPASLLLRVLERMGIGFSS